MLYGVLALQQVALINVFEERLGENPSSSIRKHGNSNRASEQGTTNSCRGSVCSCFPFESPLKEDQGKNQIDYPFLFHPHFPVNTATAGGSHQGTTFSHKG